MIQFYIEDMSRLQAVDNLERIMEIAVGTGSIKNASDVRRSLQRQARKNVHAIVRPDPSALGAIGIGFKRWQKN